jgi:hypothetical protein
MSQLFDFAARRLERLPVWVRSVNGGLAVWLSFVVVLLFLLVGFVSRWHHGAGDGRVEGDVLWHVVWITYQAVKVWLVTVVVILLYRRYHRS